MSLSHIESLEGSREREPSDPPNARPTALPTVPYVCRRCGETFYGGQHWHPICRPCFDEVTGR